MNIKKFIKDKMYLFIFCVAVIIIINIYMISLNAIRSNIGDLIYLDVLLIFIYAAFIFYEYKKWNNRCRELQKLVGCDYDITNDELSSESVEGQIIKKILEHDDKKYNSALNDSAARVKDMEEYISKWVHEIKIPISALNIMIESIDDMETEERIKTEIEKINFLVNSVMYGSRSTASAEDIFLKQENLNDIVKQCVKNNAFLLIKSSIDIQIENIDYDIYTDKKWMLYVLDQLINNVIKYVDNKKDKRILKFSCSDNDKYVELSVEDNGIGIDIEDLDRVFEKGFTGTNGRNTVYKSTGMGLYFSKKIITKLQHEISVQSVKGEYTRFTIRFYKIADYLKVTV